MPPPGGTRTPVPAYQISYATGATGFNSGLFAPGTPPGETFGNQPTRYFDFAVGANLQRTPRSYEPFGFPQLRAYANIELIRLAIETRKDQVGRMKWSIKGKDQKAGDKRHAKADDAEAILRKPDGMNPFETWLRILLEEMFVLDAPAIERRRDRAGRVIGFDIVPGDTIKILVDQTGRRPLPPFPAYQQIIKGAVWADLTSEDLIYSPRNPRANHLYGMSQVEQVIVTATMVMRRQTRQLSYFTEGNVPPGILNAPEGWTPDQIKQWQEYWDSKLSGLDAARSKILWTPKDTKYQPFVDPPIKDEFDEWIARIVAYAFSLPPTPFIKSLNRATAEESGDRALEEGLQPILLWVKRLMDGILQDDLGFRDLEFAWDRTSDLDPLKQAQIDDMYLKNGILKVNQVLERLGYPSVPGGDVNRVYLGAGPVPLDHYELQQAKADEIARQQPKQIAPQPGQHQAKGAASPRKTKAQDDEGDEADPAGDVTKLFDGAKAQGGGLAPIPFDRKVTRRARAAIKGALVDAYPDIADAAAAAVKEALAGEVVEKMTPAELAALAALAAQAAASVDLTVFRVIINDVAESLAEVATDAIRRAIAQIGVNVADDLVDQVNARAVTWTGERAAELVGMRKTADGKLIPNPSAKWAITDTVREQIRFIITEGLTENVGRDEIAKRIKEATAFSVERAELIALTEVARANSMGALDGYRAARDAGVNVKKRWILGPKPCERCVENNEEGAIELDLVFKSGDDAPPAHPNCMCAISPEVMD